MVRYMDEGALGNIPRCRRSLRPPPESWAIGLSGLISEVDHVVHEIAPSGLKVVRVGGVEPTKSVGMLAI